MAPTPARSAMVQENKHQHKTKTKTKAKEKLSDYELLK
jgi:hypothetical protein